MRLKKWFGGGSEADGERLEVEDLIVLERFDEAEARLEERLRIHPDDARSRQRLGELHLLMGRLDEGQEEFGQAAETYARAGFHDRAVAVLRQLQRRMPGDPGVAARIRRFEEMRRLSQLGEQLLAVVEKASTSPAARLTRPEFERFWQEFRTSPLVDALGAQQLCRLLAAARLERFPEGREVAGARRPESRLLLVCAGQIAAEVRSEGRAAAEVRRFGVGDLVGERVLLERRPWPAAYRAVDAVAVFVLDREGMARALTGNPDPRGLINGLRSQGHDAMVALSVRKLSGGG